VRPGRTSRGGDRGYGAHRLAGRLALPRPVTIGLAAPFTRPARSATTLAVILFGATAVILATGLDASLIKINDIPGLDQGKVLTGPAKGSSQGTLTLAQSRHIVTTVGAQPGTLRYIAVADGGPVISSVSVAGGLHVALNLVAYSGDSSSLGFPLISGHWFSAPGEVVVNTEFLNLVGLHVGGRFTLIVRGRPVPVRIAGQVYFPNGPSLYTNWQTLGGAAAGIRPRTTSSSYGRVSAGGPTWRHCAKHSDRASAPTSRNSARVAAPATRLRSAACSPS
jgi:putative ABC transport system permease protein